MDEREAAAKIVGELVWPAFLSGFLWLSRKELPSLLDRLIEFSLPGGGGAKFSPSDVAFAAVGKMKLAEESTNILPLPEIEGGAVPKQIAGDTPAASADYAKLIREDGVRMLNEIQAKVKHLAATALPKSGLARTPFGYQIDRLAAENIIPSNLAVLLRQLWKIHLNVPYDKGNITAALDFSKLAYFALHESMLKDVKME